MVDTFFKNKKPIRDRLLSFGFVEKEGGYFYTAFLADGRFEMTVHISVEEKVCTEVTDPLSGEKYVLHLVPGAGGTFVNRVREEFQDVLASVSASCFDTNVFRSRCAGEVIRYMEDKYGDRPEYLWPKFPDNAAVRRRDNSKWYAVLIVLPKSKLGIDSNEMGEIIDLRMDSREISLVVDRKRYFPGYHMNKKSWVTICLDGSVPPEEIFRRIDASYLLAAKK